MFANNRVALFIAIRLLRPSHAMTRSIGLLVSLVGIAIGVIALVVTLSTMNGFERDVRDQVLGMSGHINLVFDRNSSTNWENALDNVLSQYEIAGFSPYVRSGAMISSRDVIISVSVEGVIPESEERVTNIGNHIALTDTLLTESSIPTVVIGEKLAEKIKLKWIDEKIDVVIPIPDTSRTAALQLANELDVKYREGFIKNRYIARTFIMPGQKQRKKSVRQKLSAIELEFKDKNVLLVDDSIVRGTTSKEIVQMARSAGAKKVFFASAAPPVRYPNVYGIDMASKNEFIAHNKTTDEVCEAIGSDKLIYQNLDDLIWSVQQGNPEIIAFDCSCFDGNYLTNDIDKPYLDKLEAERSDKAKEDKITNESSELIYNDAD